jgi:hypothetical protein
MSPENFGYYERGNITQYKKIHSDPESDKQVDQVDKQIYLYEKIQPVTHSKGEVIHLCKQHYYHNGNANTGCPNYGEKEGCPPEVLHIKEAYDMNSIHLLTIQFPFEEYIDIKREINPTWTNRALINQRHWQGHLKSLLNTFWEDIEDRYPEHNVIKNPEAMGVNLEETMKKLGIQLQWCEQNEKHEIITIPKYMYHIYLLGKELKTRK